MSHRPRSRLARDGSLAGLAAGLVVVASAWMAPGGSAADATDAAAAANPRPTFQMPFPCGAKRQGQTYDNHGGRGNTFPLDFNRGGGNEDEGDPVVASAAGKVIRTVRDDGAKIVVIRHNPVWTTDYRHLSKFVAKDGAEVKRGATIGLVGRTGTASAHLHYEQQKNGVPVAIRFDGKPLDPPYTDPPPSSNGPTYTSKNC